MSSGLVKAKQYDWKDSNLAMFGSDTEKGVKKESAEAEPAWAGLGNDVSLKIWRIVKFKVAAWPQEDYGKFYAGDSYIILNTYKPDPASAELAFDVHFWIGKNSSQDEYGTAAYKTVELDTFLDDRAVQHREVQGRESDLFKGYFTSITTMAGGADTGFRHVTPETYEPRLLHFHGTRKSITVRECPRSKDRLKSDDVYILDLGLQLYQWNGNGSNKDERFKAMQYVLGLRSERNGRPKIETLEQDSTHDEHAFYAALTDDDEDEDTDKDTVDGDQKSLFRLSDASGKLQCNKVKDSGVKKSDLDSKDVFILDTGARCFVWVGSGASPAERKNGMTYAHNFLQKTAHPLIGITVMHDGQYNRDFEAALAA